ncbi:MULTISPECIES: ATP-binding cassette domain-containing protein [Geobacillus]|jgi:ABC-2 type transport system ATP-binding protein|uniref:ATP-binding cassette domain-containing protein n=1 Tax=Geobacillus TaxID=129337 RepID=UPI00017E4237|nr:MULTISPECIES: ATP-binding cassette domain-containing protein [Geobacillus]ARA97416.1 daunorubicin/doxorubicin resistance ABC transporter ATP-binding protein DrrA [Geobacillus thermodenitrificans]KQB94118.1 Daunorubicin/doxorubicin resistance ATP-binding protein DrrA [Geobacillus sp. PA-3]MEC5188289.1 ABC-2 type transport system ATP-binding protein [Geobacillus thermodenitrificans]
MGHKHRSASEHQEWAVEAHGLVKVFGDHRAVDGLELRVRTGTIYGVLGPNGAGKTTTIRMLATLLRPDGGSAQIFGYDVVKQPQIVRQLIGVTGQYASVDETLSAVENLMIFCRLLGLSRAEARRKTSELLEEFGLTEAAKRPLKHFSGGMRRRLDLAASLIAQPPLIFLDEPTTGLDPITRNQMWETIRRLVRMGSTVLLTTQYLQEADELADRIAVINHGRVVAEGTPDELKTSVGQSSLQVKLQQPEKIEAAKRIIEHVLRIRSSISAETGNITASMADPDQVTDVLVALRQEGIRLAEVNVQKPTLDEVFLAITGHGTKKDEEEFSVLREVR